MQCGYVNLDEFKQFYKFAFVRNPWDKLVSALKYRKFYEHMSFKEYVFEKRPESVLYHGTYRHVMRQIDYVCNEAGQICVDYVGRFETLQRDFDHVCRSLNIPATKLPHTNSSIDAKNDDKRSQKRHYSEYYDSETKEKVAKIYKSDIDAFNYSFETVN